MSGFRISLIMTTYNQEAFVGEAVRSALAQDCDPLDIHISDDCSPDRTFDIIQEEVAAYTGPHKVSIHRNSENRGPNGNTGKVMERVRGEFVIRCHGDDISLPHRARAMAKVWSETGASLISSNAVLIDAESREQGPMVGLPLPACMTAEEIIKVGWDKRMLGATFAWETRLFKTFGTVNDEFLPTGADRLLPFRAALLGGAVYVHAPLIKYRQHSEQQTRHLADRTQGMLVASETLQAHATMGTLALFRDVDALRKHPSGQTPKLNNLYSQLLGKVVQDTAIWVSLRNQLTRAGQRPTWVDHHLLDAKDAPDAFKPEGPLGVMSKAV